MDKCYVIVDVEGGGRLEHRYDNFRIAMNRAEDHLAETDFTAIRVFDSTGRIQAQAYQGDETFR